MALDIIYGEPRNRQVARQLSDLLRGSSTEGTVYLGYPVLATADDRVHVDALLVSADHGLVAFQIGGESPDSASWAQIVDDQDRLYKVLESHLGRHDELRQGRRLAFDINTVTVFPDAIVPPTGVDGHYCSIDDVQALVDQLPGVDAAVFRSLQAALQRVTTIKPSKRRASVQKSGSRGAILKEIEKGIANLDRWQKQAAIETPDGPQRIRGLAGSGKTVVLALKAAYLHAQHPEWRIAVAFQSRALYQQIEDLVTRFTFEHSNDRPDFERLQILHAWGASNRDGLYKSIARHIGAPYRDFNYAMSTYGRDNAFQGVCKELLDISARTAHDPMFDAVLIDEAQDLPPEFFQLVHRFTRLPKRIVWAFDELQNLSEAAMPSTDELFGKTVDGDSLVDLTEVEGEARRDIILPVCYRNSPWALATAHAVGFGIYRDSGLVQHFDDPALWTQIGYHLVEGQLKSGRKVELERAATSYPTYFPELLSPSDAVQLRTFTTEVEQDSWVAEQIAINLRDDELEYDDILVVVPDAYTSKRRASRFSRLLSMHDIDSHLVGVGSSVDQVFVAESVAIAHIYRAKGNEAPMVYVLDAQYASGTPNGVARRNTIFTAITRSRAWVRLCGWGDRINEVSMEVAAVQSNNYQLHFKIPTVKELAQLRRVHRDRSDDEVAALQKVTRSLDEAFELFDRGEIDLADLPPKLRTRILRMREELLDDDS